MIKVDFSLNQKVSSQLAFILVLILSFLVAWFSTSKAQEIVDNSRNSAVFNIEKRTQVNIPDNPVNDIANDKQ